MSTLIRRLRYGQINSALLRKLMGLYYRDGGVYVVAFGPLRGMRLQYDSALNYHAVLGLWDTQVFELLWRVLSKGGFLQENMVFCDVGANYGMYTLWFSRIARSGSQIYAFEPAPRIFARLKTQLTLNQITNVVPVNAACSNIVGETGLFIGFHHHSTSLHADWAGGGQVQPERVMVPATTLDAFFYGQVPRRAPDLIKMDIEGGGTLALQGCERCVQEKRPLIVMESHTPAEDRAISTLLLRHQYAAYRITNRRWVEAPAETHPNPEGVWGTMLLCPAEARPQIAALLG